MNSYFAVKRELLINYLGCIAVDAFTSLFFTELRAGCQGP